MAKGQIFIIIAIIMVVALVLIRTSLNLTKILENKRFLELGLERLEFQNIRNEMTKTLQVSYNQSNISDNVNSFMKFAKDSFASRTTTMSGIAVTAMFPNVTLSVGILVPIPLNVTVLNYFDDDLTNLNLTFNNVKQAFTSVPKSSRVVTNFTFTTGNDVNYSLTMNYTSGSLNGTENITIPVEIGKTKFIGFFDIRISSTRLEQRDKFTEIVTLNSTRKV